jgi:hypothetical protein
MNTVTGAGKTNPKLVEVRHCIFFSFSAAHAAMTVLADSTLCFAQKVSKSYTEESCTKPPPCFCLITFTLNWMGGWTPQTHLRLVGLGVKQTKVGSRTKTFNHLSTHDKSALYREYLTKKVITAWDRSGLGKNATTKLLLYVY